MYILRFTCALICLGVLSACSQLGAFNAVIPKDGATLVAQNVSYGGDDRQTLDIYAPTEGTKPKGTIIFVYGGSWDSGNKSDYGFAGRAFAGNGYVTAVIDYSLVPKVRYPAFVEDTAKATAWVRRSISQYGGDPKRIFLVGHSAGAYNVMMVALAPEFLQAEGLSPAILKGAVGLSGPYDFLPLDVDATRNAFGHLKNLEITQPVNRAGSSRVTPPVFLAHGLDDETVFPRNSERLARALRKAGKSVELKTYPEIGHVDTLLALSKPLRGRAPVLQNTLDFLSRH